MTPELTGGVSSVSNRGDNGRCGNSAVQCDGLVDPSAREAPSQAGPTARRRSGDSLAQVPLQATPVHSRATHVYTRCYRRTRVSSIKLLQTTAATSPAKAI